MASQPERIILGQVWWPFDLDEKWNGICEEERFTASPVAGDCSSRCD